MRAPGNVSLRDRSAEIMERHWRPDGYTSPNLETYPWQWLWDSCFHAVVWPELGRADRAVVELTTALAPIDGDGFVPHMRYHGDPTARVAFWGRAGTSSITQPPMVGHALARLHREGVPLPPDLVDDAVRSVRFLLHRRRRVDGLIAVVHPWETGCDDSPRWDHWCPDGYDRAGWKEVKGTLIETIERTQIGAPIANPGFEAGSVGFNALVAFNALELADVTGDEALRVDARGLVATLDGRFDPGRVTWVDSGEHEATTGSVRTADALLPLLVTDDRAVQQAALGALTDPMGLGGPWGPAGTDRREETYDPTGYWRGAGWPQLGYLLWLGARRVDAAETAEAIAAGVVAGADRSGLAEYWDPDTGAGGGAVPQSWTSLAVLMDGGGDRGGGPLE